MNAIATAETPIQSGDHVRVHHLASHPILDDDHYELYEILEVERNADRCDEEGCDGLTLRVRTTNGEDDWLHVHESEIEVVTDIVARAEMDFAGDGGYLATLLRLARDLAIATKVAGYEDYSFSEVRRALEAQIHSLESAAALDE